MPTKTFVAFDLQLLCKLGETKVCSKLMVLVDNLGTVFGPNVLHPSTEFSNKFLWNEMVHLVATYLVIKASLFCDQMV